MTSTTDPLRAQPGADSFGRAVAARLAAGTDELPYEVSERLRAARVRALQARKQAASRTAPVVLGSRGTASLGEEFGLWARIASVLPLLVLAAGLVAIHSFHSDRRDVELAEVDAALLTDELPPAAYADPGFAQFLKQSGRE